MANDSIRSKCRVIFLEKITRAKPVQALAEFIWNSLDANASTVNVTIEQNELGVMSKIIVRDTGRGMKYEKAAELFRSLGGSWKRTSTEEGRFLHGQDGRGRFKAFALTVEDDLAVFLAEAEPPAFFQREAMAGTSKSRSAWPGIRTRKPPGFTTGAAMM